MVSGLIDSHLPARAVEVRRVRGKTMADRPAIEEVAIEAPVALVFNGISHAVMMASPADLECLAIGFALSEGLIASPDECYGVEVAETMQGWEVQLEVSARAAAGLKERRRSMAGTTGCGVCGIESLAGLDLRPARLVAPSWASELVPATVLRALGQLASRQPLNGITGACHAAGWGTPVGELVDVMEDVGRHNALDKLLGARARRGRPFHEGFVVMSSRASYELVRKCARLGVPVLATISAPTSLAIDTAHVAGLKLFGFCRGDRAQLY